MFSVFLVLTVIELKLIAKPKPPEKSTAIQMQHENIAKKKKNFGIISVAGFVKKQKKHQNGEILLENFSQ